LHHSNERRIDSKTENQSYASPRKDICENDRAKDLKKFVQEDDELKPSIRRLLSHNRRARSIPRPSDKSPEAKERFQSPIPIKTNDSKLSRSPEPTILILNNNASKIELPAPPTEIILDS
jgi:hypothetical protein